MIQCANLAKTRARGAALIVALLVVATVVILATALSGDFLLMFRRVENQMHSEQAYAYLLGAEGVARAALLQDAKLSKDNDNLFEEWAKPQKFPTDYGWIAGQLEDMQGRFNLNSLAVGKISDQPELGKRTGPQLMLQRLLLTLPLPEPLAQDQAEALVDAITDWVDAGDEISGLSGAESQYYADAEPPGRPANRTIASPSELMWVRGMTPEIYRALRDLVTIWPIKGGKINLNTALPQVLASINGNSTPTPLDKNDLDKLLEERNARHLLALKAITDLLTGDKNIDADAVFETGQSSYFQLTAQTEFQGRRYTLRSILRRNDKDVRAVARTFGEW